MFFLRSCIRCPWIRTLSSEEGNEWPKGRPLTQPHLWLRHEPRNHWPFALESTPSLDTIHFINWRAKCLFSFYQDCTLLSGSLALEALLIGVHYEKRYINV